MSTNNDESKQNNEMPSDAKTKLIINYLPQNMSDRQLFDLFTTIGPVATCRIMRDYKSGYSYGYGFVTYVAEDDADRAIGTLNGFNVQDKRLKVSYARPPGEEIKDTNLYVTNLPRDFQDHDLDELFGTYGTIVQKNILRDKITGMPRGVAFVRYDKKEDAQTAITALNGTQLDGALVPMQVKLAEEHGKQKAAYFAGLQTGIALKQRAPAMGNYPPSYPGRGRGGPPGHYSHRGRGGEFRFNPMGRFNYAHNPNHYQM